MGSVELESSCKGFREVHTASRYQPGSSQDAVLQADVWLALWQADDQDVLDISDIEVLIHQCEVWLSGQVGDNQQRQLAECLVTGIPGVSNCHNQLRSRQSTETSPDP